MNNLNSTINYEILLQNRGGRKEATPLNNFS